MAYAIMSSVPFDIGRFRMRKTRASMTYVFLANRQIIIHDEINISPLFTSYKRV